MWSITQVTSVPFLSCRRSQVSIFTAVLMKESPTRIKPPRAAMRNGFTNPFSVQLHVCFFFLREISLKSDSVQFSSFLLIFIWLYAMLVDVDDHFSPLYIFPGGFLLFFFFFDHFQTLTCIFLK